MVVASLSEIAEIKKPALRVISLGALLETLLKSITPDGSDLTLDALIDSHQEKFASFRAVDGARWVRNEIIHRNGARATEMRIQEAERAFIQAIHRIAQDCSQELRAAAIGTPSPPPKPAVSAPPPFPSSSLATQPQPSLHQPIPRPQPSRRSVQHSSNAGVFFWLVGGAAVLSFVYFTSRSPRQVAPSTTPEPRAILKAPPPAQDPTLPAAASTTEESTQTTESIQSPAVPATPEPQPEPLNVSPPSPTRQEIGRGLLERAQNAMGGPLLADLKDSTVLVDAVLYPAGVHNRGLTHFIAPGYIRQQVDTPSGRLVLFSNGEDGWIKMPQQDLKPLTAKQIRDLSFYDLGKLITVPAITWTIIGTEPNTVQISSREGQMVTLRFDELTSLPLRMSYEISGQRGESMTAEVTFSDWRQVQGISMPFRWVTVVNGQRGREDVVLDARFNTGLDIGSLSQVP